MSNLGNKWWERRSIHGRGMLFSSPQLMWEAACEYFKAEDEATYLNRRDVVGTFQGTVIADHVTCKVPYTWEGLCLYFGASTGYFRGFRFRLKKELADGVNVEVNEDFKTVVETIDDTIRKQQLDGAHAGQLKEGLVTRYLRIADKTEISTPEDQSFNVTLKLD